MTHQKNVTKCWVVDAIKHFIVKTVLGKSDQLCRNGVRIALELPTARTPNSLILWSRVPMKETSSNVDCAPDVWRSGYLPLTEDYKEQWRTRNVMVRCGVAMYFRVESFVQH